MNKIPKSLSVTFNLKCNVQDYNSEDVVEMFGRKVEFVRLSSFIRSSDPGDYYPEWLKEQSLRWILIDENMHKRAKAGRGTVISNNYE